MRVSDQIFYQPMTYRLEPVNEESHRPVTLGTGCVLLKFKRKVLIDSGVAGGADQLDALLNEADVKWPEIDALLTTHAHPSHIGLHHYVRQQNPDVTIHAHPEAVDTLREPARLSSRWPDHRVDQIISGPIEHAVALTDQQQLDLDGDMLEVVFAPGHSSDSVCFFLPESKVLVSGDAVPLVDTMPNYANVYELRKTLLKLKRLRFDTMIAAEHGPIATPRRDVIRRAQTLLDRIDSIVVRHHRASGHIDRTTTYALEELGLEIPCNRAARQSIEGHLPKNWLV